jgi:hypothetical protein
LSSGHKACGEPPDHRRAARRDRRHLLPTLEELAELVDGKLPGGTELINYRRQARAKYKQTVLPVSFTGMPEYSFLDDETGSSAGDPGEITGAASGGGQANTMRIIERAPAGAGTG